MYHDVNWRSCPTLIWKWTDIRTISKGSIWDIFYLSILSFFLAGNYNWRDNFNVDVVYKVCYICREKFLGLHQLTKHLRLHREIDFDCLVCSKKLPSGFLLHEHMRYHYNTKEITLTETETNKTGHNSSTSYKCQFCPQLQFVTAKNFSDHMMQIHNQKPFQCSDCSVAYMHKSNLEDHIRAKHVSGEPDIPCDKCGKMFRTKTSLFVHRREQVSLYHDITSFTL